VILGEPFNTYCTLDDQKARMEFACANPALISSTMLLKIEQMLDKEDREERRVRMERLIELDALRCFIAQSARSVPGR
jgi:hypothetical protein